LLDFYRLNAFFLYHEVCRLWLHAAGMQGKQVAKALPKLHARRLLLLLLLLARHQRILSLITFNR
jgi:hypothetical protein